VLDAAWRNVKQGHVEAEPQTDAQARSEPPPALRQFDDRDVSREGAAKSAFHSLLDCCARQHDWTLVPESELRRDAICNIRIASARPGT